MSILIAPVTTGKLKQSYRRADPCRARHGQYLYRLHGVDS